MSSTSTASRLIIASAGRFEALSLLGELSQAGIAHTYIEVGVGAVRSALISKSLQAIARDRVVIFVGSCGQSKFFSKPYLVHPEKVNWAPSDVRSGRGYLVPGAEPTLSLSRIQTTETICRVEVSCAASITLHDDPKDHVFENLELYSVASAWQGVAKNFFAILGVTNQLGPDAHQQWKQHHGEVSRETADFVMRNLKFFGEP